MPGKDFSSSRVPHALLFAIVILTCLIGSAWAQNESILYNFIAFPHGATPPSSLVADPAGNLYGAANGGAYGSGIVFQLTPGSNGKWTETVLHDFQGGSDGAGPSNVIFDTHGNLYGVTGGGGNGCTANGGCGTVFELSPGGHGEWTQTILYNFAGYPNDGADPVAGLVIDAAGNFYGTTQSGGAYAGGTVFELSPGSNGTWTETVLQNFGNGTDGTSPLAALIFDAAGNLYGTTEYGGDPNCYPYGGNPTCGTVFELSPNGNGSWTETTLHVFSYNDGAYPEAGLAFDSAGNLYGTTLLGPGFACNGSGCGTVFQLHPNSDGSWTETIAYNFEGGPDGAFPVSSLISGPDGRFYGTTEHGGGNNSCDCGVVFQLTPHSDGRWTEDVLHRFSENSLPGEGRQPVASLLLDQQGNLYGTAQYGGNLGGYCTQGGSSYGCGVVFKLTPKSGHRWESSIVYAFPPSREGLNPSGGLVSDSLGNLYGTTYDGGTNCEYGGCGTVFQLQPQAGGGWKANVIHSFNNFTDGGGPMGNLVVDSSGNVYGTTSYGGYSACLRQYCGGTVFELSPTAHGWKETVLHRFSDISIQDDGTFPQAGLVLDSSGSLYGTTYLGGSSGNANCRYNNGCGTVFKLSLTGGGQWQEELLYLFQGGVDASWPASTLVFDDRGSLYGTTWGGGTFESGTVFKLTPDSRGRWREQVVYSFQGVQHGDGSNPLGGVVFDGNGNLFGSTYEGGDTQGNYCYNYGCGVVFELSPSGSILWKETVILAFQGTDGSSPRSSLVFDAAGSLYGAAPYSGNNYRDGTVFKLSPGTNRWTEQVLHHFGTGTDGAGPNGPLLFDQMGNIYGTTGGGGTDLGGTVFELSPGAPEGQWIERREVAPPHPSRTHPPNGYVRNARNGGK